MSLSTDIANNVCKKFEGDGVIYCDSYYDKRCFYCKCHDHYPSVTTSKDSIHGINISLIQNQGLDSSPSVIDNLVKGKIQTNSRRNNRRVTCASNKKDMFVPALDTNVYRTAYNQPQVHQKEHEWLENSRKVVIEEEGKPSKKSWAGFHASREPEQDRSTIKIGLLPPLTENAHSLAMVKKLHGHCSSGCVEAEPTTNTCLCQGPTT